MAETKCPNCGAGIDTDGTFCKYCGAKLPDNVERKHIEIKDVAGIERARLERERFEREKELYRKKQTAKKIKISILVVLVAAIVAGFFLFSELNRILYVEIVIIIVTSVLSVWETYMKNRRK